jgi:hypothetical protein
LAAASRESADAVRSQLEDVGLLVREPESVVEERGFASPKARTVRAALTAPTRSILEEISSRLPPTYVAVLRSALVQWADNLDASEPQRPGALCGGGRDLVASTGCPVPARSKVGWQARRSCSRAKPRGRGSARRHPEACRTRHVPGGRR